jgi:hypothetical protein
LSNLSRAWNSQSELLLSNIQSRRPVLLKTLPFVGLPIGSEQPATLEKNEVDSPRVPAPKAESDSQRRTSSESDENDAGLGSAAVQSLVIPARVVEADDGKTTDLALLGAASCIRTLSVG